MQRVLASLALGLVLLVSSRARADQIADASEPEVAEASTDERASEQARAPASLPPVEPSPDAEATAITPPSDETDDEIAAGLAERRRLRPWHILFGNLTWAASNVATVFGFLQFHDRYGFDGTPASAGCAGPSPIFGDTCAPGSVPVPHVVAITALTLFYGSAFTIGALMPDPLGAGDGPSARSQEINVHRALRWTSLAIMALQIVLGAISQNVDFNDFGADRAMAATHLALGTLSWGVITAQGIVGSLLAY